MRKNNYPEWVLQHKRSGTEIRLIKGRYYLYEVSSHWDRELKRSKKKTGAYLGSITQEGFKAKKSKPMLPNQSVQVRNFGAILYLKEKNEDILKVLQTLFPHKGSTLFLCAIFRLLYL